MVEQNDNLDVVTDKPESDETVNVLDDLVSADAPQAEPEQSEQQKQPLPEPQWFILHTYSGYEDLVKQNLETSFQKNNVEERLIDIRIPKEDVVEEKNGKRKVVRRKMFPSYVLVKMVYTRDMWHFITGTRGITGFVGPQGKPTPLTEDEIRRMQLEKVTVRDDFQVGDNIRVVNGPLTDMTGEIKSINPTTGKCSVDVNIFGRLVPAELDSYQIEKIEK